MVEAAILSLVPSFTKLCGLDQKPLVVFNRQDAKVIASRHYKRLRTWRRYNGIAFIKANLIWVSPNHEHVEPARNTLAHEFVHFRYPYLYHTKQFYEKVDLLLKGQSLGKYRSRKTLA